MGIEDDGALVYGGQAVSCSLSVCLFLYLSLSASLPLSPSLSFSPPPSLPLYLREHLILHKPSEVPIRLARQLVVAANFDDLEWTFVWYVRRRTRQRGTHTRRLVISLGWFS